MKEKDKKGKNALKIKRNTIIILGMLMIHKVKSKFKSQSNISIKSMMIFN